MNSSDDGASNLTRNAATVTGGRRSILQDQVNLLTRVYRARVGAVADVKKVNAGQKQGPARIYCWLAKSVGFPVVTDERALPEPKSPSRDELRTVVLIVLKIHTAMLNLALAISDGAGPDAVINAVRPVSDDHHRLMQLMRELTNAGVDSEWDHQS